MIRFFQRENTIFALDLDGELNSEQISKLEWLFGDAKFLNQDILNGTYIGPRREMISPWSTNAVEITQNMSIEGINRIEEFENVENGFSDFDPMLKMSYTNLGQDLYHIDIEPEAIQEIDNIGAFNASEGLSLSDEEVAYLEEISNKIGRPLTDSEVFGFSQINSEHCRHKIFNGTFIIDGEEMPKSLFKLIKETSAKNPHNLVSAYKDNVAFIKGPKISQFAPKSIDKADFFERKEVQSVLSLKAETHNFPTTVEPFNGAATGSGGEIRDRLAGGIGSLPLAGTAVYMTSYSRLEKNRPWEEKFEARDWLYQTPMDILIKASNGASDFGNKFGQPLITGSVLTFEHEEDARLLGFDKVIMQAGGIGYGIENQALKHEPQEGDAIVIMGGDNYRIGMGGAAVSSADTGAMSNAIELNAIQRSNPEMQKRVANAIRGMVEQGNNPIVSIHDHGAGGHLNCLSELVEDTGGIIDTDQLPVGDPTLSKKELIGNESQERMGLVIKEKDYEFLESVAQRERAPIYKVGKVTNDDRFTFESSSTGEKPMDLDMEDLFGSSPKTIMNDEKIAHNYDKIKTDDALVNEYLNKVLKLEAVACKDWLTNKVDRCVGGLVAKQQTTGSLQLPLNNVGVMALDYPGKSGIATSIGHNPVASLIDEAQGAKMAITEALTNMVWAPLEQNLKSVSLSANWMWPCNNPGEDARLYDAVQAVSEYAISLGINIPTGKDSLSMKQKYPNKEVISPGTVIISGAGHCDDINKVVEPNLKPIANTSMYYINLSGAAPTLGGSSLAQVLNKIGTSIPGIKDASKVKAAFNTLQSLISKGYIHAGHDVSSGGLITTLLEMCFANNSIGASVDLSFFKDSSLTEILFSENNGLVFQGPSEGICEAFAASGVLCEKIGNVETTGTLKIVANENSIEFDVASMRDIWYETSLLLDRQQTANGLADERFDNYKNQALNFKFPEQFKGQLPKLKSTDKPVAAVIREKGSNSEREMANALALAGFDVKDIHMTDLISGREDLKDIQFLGAVGGFSNSDVLGSAKGWAGAFKYNEKANKALLDFFKREDTLSVGICNGCQLFMELDLIYPGMDSHPKMKHNKSEKHESAFTSVQIVKNNSIMLSSLEGANLGVWISHGEGRFDLKGSEEQYNIAAKYTYAAYPSNPNGSDYDAAMVCSKDGRHLAMMPHIERSTYTWNWAHYPEDRKQDQVSPWLEAFVNAEKWISNKKN
ncbi:MAG: phosphoribosylformylglycinamidine synthase [Flavobacteriaceae bacterium]